jgi:hypothetical protein
MKRRENFIWGFLIVIGIIMIFYSGIKTYTISKVVRDFKKEEAQNVLGTDPQLLETVNKMESELKERIEYKFLTETDPLKLSEVVRSPRLLAALGYSESFEGEEDMRLNLTIVGNNPYASIKWNNKYYNLSIGDTIAGYMVTEIDVKKVLLQKPGKTLTLYNRLDPKTIAEQANLAGETESYNY